MQWYNFFLFFCYGKKCQNKQNPNTEREEERNETKRKKGGKENTYIDNLAMVPVEMALVEIGIGN